MGARISVIALTIGLAAGAPAALNAQHGGTTGQTLDSPAPTAMPPARMAEMMKRHAQMMAEMKKADADLASLVSRMNSATGEKQLDAMAAVVNELVRRQRAMHERMAAMTCMAKEHEAPASGAPDQHQH